MEPRSGPRLVTSKHRIVYRRSEWKVHEFEVMNGGEKLCSAAVLRVRGSLVVWAGRGAARLGELALAVPGAARGGPARAAATALLAGDAAPQLARRLASRLHVPVYVALGDTFDRFTLPLVEKALIAEIKGRPTDTLTQVSDLLCSDNVISH